MSIEDGFSVHLANRLPGKMAVPIPSLLRKLWLGEAEVLTFPPLCFADDRRATCTPKPTSHRASAHRCPGSWRPSLFVTVTHIFP